MIWTLVRSAACDFRSQGEQEIRQVISFFLITLGLFTFVLNAFMLWLTSTLAGALGLGFHVDGFGAAFVGALVVSLVSFALSIFVAQPISQARRA